MGHYTVDKENPAPFEDGICDRFLAFPFRGTCFFPSLEGNHMNNVQNPNDIPLTPDLLPALASSAFPRSQAPVGPSNFP